MGKLEFGIFIGVIALIDIVLSILIFSKKNHSDNYMGITLAMTAVVAVSYYIGAFETDYRLMSILTSVHFSAISIMLNTLFLYIISYTQTKRTKMVVALEAFFQAFCIVDVIIQMINPFWEISIHYNYRPDSLAMWEYEPMVPYYMHLGFCYLILVAVFYLLIKKSVCSSRIYRQKYLTILIGISFIVVLNALFLIKQHANMLDISILFYALIGFFMYWNRYSYSQKGMLNPVRQMVLNELEQPVFLFDRDNKLVITNSLGKNFIQGIAKPLHKDTVTFQNFIELYNLPIKNEITTNVHFQLNYRENNDSVTIYRVDIKILKDKKGRKIGHLVVMTDTSLEMDLLTGFHSKSSFAGLFRNKKMDTVYPVSVAICDINKLSLINRKMGESQGDMAIQLLAHTMRNHLPQGTYFARLEDANLLAICQGYTTEQVRACLAEIRKILTAVDKFCIPLEIQSAIAEATEEKPSIIDAVDTAFFSMKTKKLMDGSSAHSSLLDSLAQTLLESDNTTRAHVERTKTMGELLGNRLNFTDAQQTNLSLLCLLHDIGKLGIPLEILNKPGKLNNAEWDVMKSHVDKGYRIAKASSELEEIADLILHHHESWNGKGYPDGLKQESIPLLSRVIAIVDSYDAMTNDRPYHKAISDMEAREELRRCAGVQFDPSIVSEFLSLLEELHPLTETEKTIKRDAGPDKHAPIGVKEIFSINTSEAETVNVLPLKYCKYVTDSNLKIVSIDANFEELTGYSYEDLEKYNLSQLDLIPREDKNNYVNTVGTIMDNTNEVYVEHVLLRKDGSYRNVICFGRNFFDSVSRLPRIEIIVFDASTTSVVTTIEKNARESANRALLKWENLMRKDSLTGLLNHESFINDVEIDILNHDNKVVLLLLDVDYFKKYNDSYGHLAGDKLLKLVAVMLESSVREIGFAGRLGGDEFAAVVRVPFDASEDKIKSHIEHVFTMIMNATSTQEQGATISMGVATLDNVIHFNELYQAADKALYRAKEKGRHCYSF